MRLLILALLLLPQLSICQDEKPQAKKARKLSLVAGLAFPDLVHFGLTYSLSKRITAGVSSGFTEFMTINAEYNYHFGKKSIYVDLPTFYWTERLNYWLQEDKFLFLASGIGKRFYLEENFGLNIDGGITTQLFFWQDKSNCIECDEDGYKGILPSFRLQFFYKLK